MKLDQINNENPFRTPPDYFNDLPGRVQKRVEQPPSFWQFPAVQFTLRYALPVVFIFGVIYISILSPKPNQYDLANVETTAMIEYLDYNDVTMAQIDEVFELDDATLEALFADEVELDENTIIDELEWQEVELLLMEENNEDI